MKQYKIFEGNTLQEAMDKLLKAGYFPVTNLKEAWDKKQELIPDGEIDTGVVVFQKGIIRKLAPEEAKDLKKLYANNGRLLFVGYNLSGFDGYGSLLLDDNARFLGVKEDEEQKHTNYCKI